LDLFAIHGINNDDILELAMRKGGALETLQKLKADGVIGAIGFSTHAPPETIIRTIRTGAFDYVNLWHSYIYRFNEEAIAEAAKQDMGVFIISPNDKGGMLFDPPEKLCRMTAPLSPMTFNDLFILLNPQIHTISCGASKASDFDEHVAAVERMDELSDEVGRIATKLDAALENVVDAEWIRSYQNGLPDWSDTPEGLNIPVILWLWNLAKAFDLQKYAQMRYNLMGNAEHWFPGCKPAVFPGIDRTMLRKSLDASPYADRIMDILEEAHTLMVADEVKRLSKDD
ncbi:MAG: aldo/keto reductase, partial [Planctomycetota bacterium]